MRLVSQRTLLLLSEGGVVIGRGQMAFELPPVLFQESLSAASLYWIAFALDGKRVKMLTYPKYFSFTEFNWGTYVSMYVSANLKGISHCFY